MNKIFEKYKEITKVVKIGEIDGKAELLVFTKPNTHYQATYIDLYDVLITNHKSVYLYMAADERYAELLNVNGDIIYEAKEI